jgi:hypothetical protein
MEMKTIACCILLLLAACAPTLTVKDGPDGTKYVFSRSDTKGGVEMVCVDRWRGEAILVTSHCYGGSSVLYGATQGAVAGAMIGGGMIGAAAARVPDKTVNNLSATANPISSSDASSNPLNFSSSSANAFSSAGAAAAANATAIPITTNTNTNLNQTLAAPSPAPVMPMPIHHAD